MYFIIYGFTFTFTDYISGQIDKCYEITVIGQYLSDGNCIKFTQN